jgi:hypothetical protein
MYSKLILNTINNNKKIIIKVVYVHFLAKCGQSNQTHTLLLSSTRVYKNRLNSIGIFVTVTTPLFFFNPVPDPCV